MFKHQGFVQSGMLFVRARVFPHPTLAAVSAGTARTETVLLKVDTGARFTNVDADVLSRLGIPPSGETEVWTSLNESRLRPVHHVVVSLEFFDDGYGTTSTADVLVGAIARSPTPSNLPASMPSNHRGLLGLDVLNHFRLSCDGPSRTVELTCEVLPRLRT